MNTIQRDIDSTYHDITHLRKNIIQACRNYLTLTNKLTSESMSISRLVNNLYTSIVNYEAVQKADIYAYYQQNDDNQNEKED